MKIILKIAELISTDIRSRANADIIRSALDGVKGNIILDFAGVISVDSFYRLTNEATDMFLDVTRN